MAVYVDNARHPFKGYLMCHMTADTLGELHHMASRVGMKRQWFQMPPKASFPHYDIPEHRRSMAIEYGAVEINERSTLYYAACLGVEWAGLRQDEQLLIRYNKTLQRALKYKAQ